MRMCVPTLQKACSPVRSLMPTRVHMRHQNRRLVLLPQRRSIRLTFPVKGTSMA